MYSQSSNKEYKFTSKSQNKSKALRMLQRKQRFDKNRDIQSSVSYQQYYPPQIWSNIKLSQQAPIPQLLPPLSIQTISYYRRSGKPVFKTKVSPEQNLDPHMTFQSLWSLASKDDIQQYPDYQNVIKEYQDELKIYMTMPYAEIREMAGIAAGNKILGREQDILKIVKNDTSQLWILINHVLERKISFEYLFNFISESNSIIFCTVFEMTNIQKDEINDYIVNNEQIFMGILNCVQSKFQETQKYAIRIIGNILAQSEDYGSKLAHYKILDYLFPVLKSKNKQTRRDICWLIGNYCYQKSPACQTLLNQKIMTRLCSMLKDQSYVPIKIQLYFIFTHLIGNGDKKIAYQMINSQRILQQCSNDIEIDDNRLCYIILQLISRIIQVGQQFVDYEEDTTNQFIRIINYSPLRKSIQSKTFYSNDDISTLSFEIIDRLNVDGMDEMD